MASGPSVATAREILDMILAGGVEVRLWTDAPAFDGTSGTEVTGGGYDPPTVTFNPAVAGTGGQIAKGTNLSSFVMVDLPVASTDVVAISVHDPSTGDLKWLNDSWTSPVAWSAGQSPMFGAGVFGVAFVPVP